MDTDQAYTIVKDNSLSGLLDEVNQRMLKGWNPLGGLCTLESTNWTYYYQAMVRLPDRSLTHPKGLDPGTAS